jgi:hypothetical protein
MSARAKLLGGVVAAVLAAVLSVTLYATTDARAYYIQGRCVCGHNGYVRIVGTDYLSYSPGHGMPEHLSFIARPRGDGWDLIRPPVPPGQYWEPFTNSTVTRVRIHDGGLYVDDGTHTNRLPKVLNPWPIWIAGVFKR